MRLVVAGGGVAGPAVALAARRQGLDAVVLERRAHADPDEGSWVTVAPNGLDALDALGLLEKARTIGAASRTNRMFGATGRLLGELSLGVPLVDGTVALTMKRSALAVLLQDAARAAGAEVLLGADVTAVNEQPGGVVAELATGERIAGDVLVGADGVHSRIRTQIDAKAPDARYLGLANFGGITPAEHVPTEVDLKPEAWHFVFGQRAFFGAHPLPDGRVVWFVNVPRPKISPAERTRTTVEEWLGILAALVADDAGPATTLIRAGSLELAGDNTYDLPHVPTWWRGRTVLVGDAVHAPSPSSGQGTAMALEDAVVLARALRGSTENALADYEHSRRARVEKIVKAGARTSSTKIPGPITRHVQDAMLRLIFRYAVTERSTAWITGHRLPH